MRALIIACAVVAGMTLTLGCSGGPRTPVSTAPTSQAAVATTSETPQQRDERIRQKLIEAGCSSNSCIQTYFGCAEGYITGDACAFYREHPFR